MYIPNFSPIDEGSNFWYLLKIGVKVCTNSTDLPGFVHEESTTTLKFVTSPETAYSIIFSKLKIVKKISKICEAF